MLLIDLDDTAFGGAVIDDHDAVVGIGQPLHRLQALNGIPPAVIAEDEDEDCRMSHCSPSEAAILLLFGVYFSIQPKQFFK